MLLCRRPVLRATPSRCFVREQHLKHQRKHRTRAEAHESRRTVLVSLGICSTSLSYSAQAEETGNVTVEAGSTNEDPGVKVLRSAAGFEFLYPASWLVAFERGDSMKEGTIAFVGNFLYVDTFSVERLKMDATTTTGDADLQSVAEDMAELVAVLPTSISFERLDGAHRDTKQGAASVYVIEYNVEICKGLITEGLGGKKACKDAKDNELLTVSRHHLLGVTKTEDVIYVLKASCPSERWEIVKNDLWMTLNSFVAYTTRG